MKLYALEIGSASAERGRQVDAPKGCRQLVSALQTPPGGPLLSSYARNG